MRLPPRELGLGSHTGHPLWAVASLLHISQEDGGELDEILKMDSRPSVHFTDEECERFVDPWELQAFARLRP